MAVVLVIAGCSGGAADNTNGGQVKDAAPLTTGTNKKGVKMSEVGVRGGLYSAAPGQAHGIPK
jgi:hypothetical protein